MSHLRKSTGECTQRNPNVVRKVARFRVSVVRNHQKNQLYRKKHAYQTCCRYRYNYGASEGHTVLVGDTCTFHETPAICGVLSAVSVRVFAHRSNSFVHIADSRVVIDVVGAKNPLNLLPLALSPYILLQIWGIPPTV